MKLWLLRPAANLAAGNNPWKPWYDRTFGFVIRADSEKAARAIADDEGGPECGSRFGLNKGIPAWTDPAYSTCIELLPEGGDEGVIMQDTARA